MYTVTKRMEISAAHYLVLDYESKCEHLHGHNWIISVRCLDLCAAPGGKSTHLAACLPEGSLLVSNEVIRSRSHILAENIAKWICDTVPHCVKVTVQESEGNVATYEL